MINIIVEFTEKEKAAIDELESRYEKLFSELDLIINARKDEPDQTLFDEGNAELKRLQDALPPEPIPHDVWSEYKAKEQAIAAEQDRKYNEWFIAGGEAWGRAMKEKDAAIDKLNEERTALYAAAERRQFSELGADIKAVLNDAKSQARQLLYNSHQYFTGNDKPGVSYNEKYVSNATRLLNASTMRGTIYKALKLHIEALRTDEAAFNEFTEFVNQLIRHSEFIDRASAEEMTDELPTFISSIVATATRYPKNYIAPTDKISNLAFCGELNGEAQQLAMERRGSKKQITTLVSIDFEKLNGAVQIRGRKELTAYDREVHDAIITLFVDGGNEYITPQMIYQAMTGNPKAYLNPKQAEAISDSITKCMYSRVIINADEEAKAYGFEKFKYDGSLISGERVTATLNGNVLECLHLLRKPILYEYADKKNQIGRFDIKLLNSPINKTEEIITLQGYLYRRILSMKGSSTLSKTIVYETVYNQIGVEASSDGALRKKKSKVRDQIKSIFDFWKQEGFILGYCENKRKTEIYSVTIRV